MEGLKVGKYHVVAKIGSGAMGEVYKAHDPVLRRDVAVKTMAELYAADDQLVARFRREAQSAARLNHPNIVTVFDFGEELGRFYMAMELLDGSDLKELIAARGLSDLWDKLDVMEQVAEGLAYAHQQGIVHRDLKPANLRVLPNGRVKIMDFGLARIGTSEMTRAGTVMGTPNYMSPEQVKGTQVDARSDVFSLGAVFYELLTSKKAFDAESMHKILFKVLEEQPEPVQRWVPTLPAPFGAFVEKCLDKDPQRRFQHAGEMRDALRKVREALASGQYSVSADDAEATASEAAPVDLGAPTMMAPPGTTMDAASRRATTGATALDLKRRPVVAPTLHGAPTLSGHAPTEMGEDRFEEPAASRWPLYAGVGVLVAAVAGAGVVVLRSRSTTAPPPAAADVTSEQVGALKQALVGNQVELARVDLENKDYQAAIGRAQRALTIDGSSTEARQILERAQRTAADLEAAAVEARTAFDAGDTDRASRALARVLALDPRHPVAGELSAALNVHFRKQAEDARGMSDDARRAAQPAQAADPEGFGRAERLSREASGLLQRSEFAVATQKFLEARDAFERSRRTVEVAARAAAARAAAAVPVTVPPTTVRAAAQVPPIIVPPVAPAATLPAPTLPAAPPLAVSQEPAIRKVIGDYGRAIEGKDIGLFKAVKPNLTADEEKRLQDAFRAIKSQQVGITIESVAVDGAQATVKVRRQDTINGKSVQAIQQVFRLSQSGGAWTITTIGVQ
jgi:tetratricopeptide (TPR) repeat protein